MTANVEKPASQTPCRVLSLDGGGAKGFYTLGVLKELEGLIGSPLCEKFDLIYGTSTGAIIAALTVLGYRIDAIHALYIEHLPKIMGAQSRTEKSRMLAELASKVFGDRTFNDAQTGIGIVTTRWANEKPMIFKGNVAQAHGRRGTFVPGFGCTIGAAVQASCSAYPFFDRKIVKTSAGETVELLDGGFCANNPTLYAIADAAVAFGKLHADIKVVSVGVGVYPKPKPSVLMRIARRHIESIELLEKTLEINTQSMEQLRTILFNAVQTVRISDTFHKPEMATDFLECDLSKLDTLFQSGRESFGSKESELAALLA
jgi:uncharacterized protein